MCDRCNPRTPATPGSLVCDDIATSPTGGTSRREFLKSSIGIGRRRLGDADVAIPRGVSPRAPVPEIRMPSLRRVQGQRRILLKGGVVLTLDPQVGDFAQGGRADRGRQDPRGPPEYRGVGRRGRRGRRLEPDRHSRTSSTPTAIPTRASCANILISGLLNPDYNRDIQTTLTPAYQAADAYAGILVTALGMIDMGTTAMVDISQVVAYARAQRRLHSGAAGIRHPRGLRLSPRRRAGRAISAGHQAAAADILQLQGPAADARAHRKSQRQCVHAGARGRRAGRPASRRQRSQSAAAGAARAGLLRPGDEYIHCLGINDAAWRLIKDTGGHVSICAPIDMAMGHGLPAIQEALDHGFRPSLSSDHGVTHRAGFLHA